MKDIEIPFGAKDSELVEATYSIPEGMEAVIEGDKVIIRRKESEDEKIRKALIGELNTYFDKDTKIDGFSIERIIAWLEDQGQHYKFRNGIQVGDKVTRNDAGWLVNLSQLKRVAKKNERQGEQKPVEWSEEDEEILITILSDGIRGAGLDMLQVNWLKSLRPQNTWKPSELQLECLSDAIEYYNSLGYPAPKLKELYEQLKKL